MSEDTVSGFRVLFRRDIAANWTSVNPILGNGEPGFETDTGLLKIGDGVTGWNALTYYQSTERVPDPAKTRLFVDCSGGNEVVDIKTYTNIAVYKIPDETENTVILVDTTPRFVPANPLQAGTESVSLFRNGEVWYPE